MDLRGVVPHRHVGAGSCRRRSTSTSACSASRRSGARPTSTWRPSRACPACARRRSCSCSSPAAAGSSCRVRPARPGRRAQAVGLGLNHLSFGVQDIHAEYERLKAAGVRFTSEVLPLDFGPGEILTGWSVVYFSDPWGLTLELLGPTPATRAPLTTTSAARRSAMGRLTGKVGLVTGAAGAQGRAFALAFAREGADLVLADITRDIDGVPYRTTHVEELAATLAAVEELGARAVAVEADVRSQAALDAAVARGVEVLGRIDVLVANAGVWVPAGPFPGDLRRAVGPDRRHRPEGRVADDEGGRAAHDRAGQRRDRRDRVGQRPRGRPRLRPLHRRQARRARARDDGRQRDRPPWGATSTRSAPASSPPATTTTRPPGTRSPAAAAEHARRARRPATAGRCWRGRGMLEPDSVSGAVVFLASDEARDVTGVALPVDAGHLATPASTARRSDDGAEERERREPARPRRRAARPRARRRGTRRAADARLRRLLADVRRPARRALGACTTIAWDMRGHGASDYPDDPAAYSTPLVMDDIAALLDANGIDRGVLVGHSVGGYLSLRFALLHPGGCGRWCCPTARPATAAPTAGRSGTTTASGVRRRTSATASRRRPTATR